jgi:hypothetical protein
VSGKAKWQWMVLVTGVAVVVLVASAIAQQGQGGGRRGGFGGNAVFGVVGSVDYNTGVIGVQGQNGQQTWIAVTPQTQLTRTQEASAQELQVGDTVIVMGQPTAITASQVQIGEQAMMGPFGAFGAGPAGAPGGAQGGGPGGPGRRFGQGGAMVSGQITALEPLTLTTPEGTAVQVTLAQDVRVSRTVPATIQNVVIGDQLVAFGQAAQDGYYYAQSVRIGNVGGFGMFGGRGGRRGGGGQ